MNEISTFINTHHDIESVALVYDAHVSYTDIRGFLEDVNIDRLCVVSSLAERDIKDVLAAFAMDKCLGSYHVPCDITFCGIEDFQGMEGRWAMCTYTSPRLLLKADLHPTYLLSVVNEGHISAFKIWEAYRGHTEHILIRTNRAYKSPEILDWKRDPANDIELSVILPMYNVSSYLDQCIESVTAWKAPYAEFLFVNDGSSDDSRDVVLRWADRDSRIKLLDKENGGCASARQYGLERARGRYIGFVDPDDYVDPQMHLKLLRAALIGSYDMTYCGYNEYYESTQQISPVPDAIHVPYSDGIRDRHMILDLINYRRVAIWRCIFRREMLDSAGIHFYTDIRRFDDLPFSIETIAASKSVKAVPEHLYYYRLARPGQDVSADDERLYTHFEIFDYLDESIAKKHEPYLTDCLQICKVNTHLWAIGKIRDEFLKHYVQRAIEDLDKTGEYSRTYKIVKERSGKDVAELYRAIVHREMGRLARYKG